MTPKQILDSFSETLMMDERILTARERALLTSLLQHAKAATAEDQETGEAVRSVIASAVGETVGQRAFSVLGGSIVERILENSSLPLGESLATEFLAKPREPQSPGKSREPQSPGKPMRTPAAPGGGPESPGVKAPPAGPESPGVKVPPAGPQSPGARREAPAAPSGPESPGTRREAPAAPSGPQSPGRPLRTPGVPAPGPESPGSSYRREPVKASLVLAERPQSLPAKCVVLDEFLAPQELESLIHFALDHETDFHASEVVSPQSEGGVINYEHRRSRVLMELAEHEGRILERIKAVLPEILEKLGMEDFNIADVEAQITASNDGDYFHFHNDNAQEQVASRYLTFVYFFHHEPRQFEGGELRIHDARLEGDNYVSEGSYQTIVPEQNQIVFFPCEVLHEITPVKCSSQAFADSRFTLNGWLRR